MKIVVNALSALRGGGQTYIKNFLEYLPEGDDTILLLVNSKNKSLFKAYRSERIKIYEAKWASVNIIYRVFWEFFTLPSFFNSRKALSSMPFIKFRLFSVL